MSLIREFLSKFFAHFNCKGLHSIYVYVCLHEFMCTTCTQGRRRPEGVRSPDHQSYRRLLLPCGGYRELSLTPLQGLYVLLRADPCMCMLCTYTWPTQAREGCGICYSLILYLISWRQRISLTESAAIMEVSNPQRLPWLRTLVPQPWGYKGHSCLFTWSLGSELKSSCIHSKSSHHWAIPTAQVLLSWYWNDFFNVFWILIFHPMYGLPIFSLLNELSLSFSWLLRTLV